jgi:hypothetical protein
MEHQHPEMPNQPLGAAQLNTYGMQQDIDSDSRAYGFDAERLVRHLVARSHDHPAVIGWQTMKFPYTEPRTTTSSFHPTASLHFAARNEIPISPGVARPMSPAIKGASLTVL